MTDVCSKELRLTSNIIHIDKDKFTLQERRDIVEPLLDNFVSKDKVCAGYMVKYDKTFIHPLDYGEGMENDIIGIIAKVTDDNVYVISVHVNRCQYAYEPCDKGKLKDEDKYFYPAIDFCKEHSTWETKKGEWCLPSLGEMHQMYDNNINVLNASLWLINRSYCIRHVNYWTSTEYDNGETYITTYLPIIGTEVGQSIFNMLYCRPILVIKIN